MQLWKLDIEGTLSQLVCIMETCEVDGLEHDINKITSVKARAVSIKGHQKPLTGKVILLVNSNIVKYSNMRNRKNKKGRISKFIDYLVQNVGKKSSKANLLNAMVSKLGYPRASALVAFNEIRKLTDCFAIQE